MKEQEEPKSSIKDNINKTKKKQSAFIAEFKEFINRGSVVEMAVGVAVGGAFTTIVNSLVNDIVMPIVSLIAGGVNFSGLTLVIPNFFGNEDQAVIAYGNFIQNVINFLIIAFCIFMVVRFMNKLNRKKEAISQKIASKRGEN